MLQVYYIKDGEFRKLARNEDFQKIWRELHFIWILAIDPTLDEHSLIAMYLSVDPKSLPRVLEYSQKGRYHRFFDFSAFHVPIMVAKPIQHTETALILLGERMVATIAKSIQPDAIEEVEETIRNLISSKQEVTPSIVAVRIVQEIIERNTIIIDDIVKGSMELEQTIADVDISIILEKIQRFRHLQNEFYQHLTIQRHIVDLMLQHVPRHLQLDEDLQAFLSTALSEIERQQQTLEINARGLTDLVSLHSVLLANRLNRVIVILTAITVTVAVPSLIANILGMYNIFYPLPLLFLPGGIPVYTWQIQLLIMIPAMIIPIIWVIRKGWVRMYKDYEKRK
jgi:Mg2+ and Co2+ transporter CorA